MSDPVKPCVFCGQTSPQHKHYTVIVRENGTLLGRVTPDGATTTRKIHAAMMSRETADRIAADINAGGKYTATAKPF